MALSDHINDIITAAKALPNGESKNRMLSHLKDAQAHAIVMEGNITTSKPEAIPGALRGLQQLNNSVPIGECTCIPGALDSECPCHGL